MTPTFRPITSVLSAMHRGDILLLSSASSSTVSLPVNPYPVHPGTPIRAHFVADKPPVNGSACDREGWTPWVGGTWRKWVKGTVVGYRDYAGREAQVGRPKYDAMVPCLTFLSALSTSPARMIPWHTCTSTLHRRPDQAEAQSSTRRADPSLGSCLGHSW